MKDEWENTFSAIIPQDVRLVRNFVRKCKFRQQWRTNVKEFESIKFKMADGFAPKRYDTDAQSVPMGGSISSRPTVRYTCFFIFLCWNWPKITGGSDVEMFEILHIRDWNLKPIFHSKMSVCRHELGLKLNHNLTAIPTLWTPSAFQRTLNYRIVYLLHCTVLHYEGSWFRHRTKYWLSLNDTTFAEKLTGGKLNLPHVTRQ